MLIAPEIDQAVVAMPRFKPTLPIGKEASEVVIKSGQPVLVARHSEPTHPIVEGASDAVVVTHAESGQTVLATQSIARWATRRQWYSTRG